MQIYQLIMYLAEYWSGKYIIYFVSRISDKLAYSIKLFLPYIRAFKEEVSIIHTYSDSQTKTYILRVYRAHFLMCRCI